jgi:acetoin utilization protein AcuB
MLDATMTKPKLTVQECMSPSPYTIQCDASLTEAHEMMEKYKIRHLPVLDGEELVGVLSIRDIHMLQALDHVDPDTLKVGQAAQGHVYTVQRSTDLKEVAANMGGHKYGSAIVMDGGKVVGVFTTVDAMRVLINLLR